MSSSNDRILIAFQCESLKDVVLDVTDQAWHDHYAPFLKKAMLGDDPKYAKINFIFKGHKPHVFQFLEELKGRVTYSVAYGV